MNDIDLARRVIEHEVIGDRLGLLTTADHHGKPHTTWMATYAFVNQSQIITLTSPDSLKATNLAKNHHAEWLFTSEDFDSLVYFTGKAYVEDDPVYFKKYWNLIPDKHRAYFLQTYNSPPGFIAIRTDIEAAYLKIPKQSKSVELDVCQLLS